MHLLGWSPGMVQARSARGAAAVPAAAPGLPPPSAPASPADLPRLLRLQAGAKPPTFVLFVNDTKLFPEDYRKFIERQFRCVGGWVGYWGGAPGGGGGGVTAGSGLPVAWWAAAAQDILKGKEPKAEGRMGRRRGMQQCLWLCLCSRVVKNEMPEKSCLSANHPCL
jgi:hypothetical protein